MSAAELSYRERQEAAVAAQRGSSSGELLLLLSLMPLASLFFRLVCFHTRMCGDETQRKHSSKQSTSKHRLEKQADVLRFLVEFTCLMVPISAGMFFGDHLVELVCVLGVACSILWVFRPTKRRQQNAQQLGDSARKPFITAYRSCMMFSTCVAILAVDFVFFERRFAKTETFGISLMDTGVGSFMFSAGLVSPLLRRGAFDTPPEGREQVTQPAARSSHSALLRSLRSALPLFVLGAGRLFTTKATDYHVHTSEYGVHWNFFITLGFLSLIVSALKPSPRSAPIWALLIGIVYQLALQFGLTHYVLEAPRISLIDMNKEGVCSLLGYVVIHLLGFYTGSLFFTSQDTASHRSSRPKHTSLWFLVALAFLCWIFYWLMSEFVQEPSRRLANIPYVAHVVGLNVLLLIAFQLVDQIQEPSVSFIFEGLNANALPLFLLANLGTGAINLSMHTLDASLSTGRLIVLLYLLILCSVAFVCYARSWRLKFW